MKITIYGYYTHSNDLENCLLFQIIYFIIAVCYTRIISATNLELNKTIPLKVGLYTEYLDEEIPTVLTHVSFTLRTPFE